MKIVKGSVTYPKGFKAGGYAAGIKNNGALDLAIVFSETQAATAIATTTNMVKAAPVVWDNKIVKKNPWTRAIVANSGNANACTGKEGMQHVELTAQTMADTFNIKPEEVIVSSTGVIGVPLPIKKIVSGVTTLASNISESLENGDKAANAILTTDLVPKTVAVDVDIDGVTVHIAGMAKGSGMICPNMATMLSYVTTDASISPECLQEMLDNIVKDTYNMMSVDGDMSTNDTVVILSNGLAGNTTITEKNDAYNTFFEALYYVNETLAKSIIKDGEGATKFIETVVSHANSVEEARILAKAVIQSSLVKTAIFGEDANWGRVLSSVGASGVQFDPMNVSVWFKSNSGQIQLLDHGTPISFDEEFASTILKDKELQILIDMETGVESATSWGCDLSYDYVKINGDYRT